MKPEIFLSFLWSPRKQNFDASKCSLSRCICVLLYFNVWKLWLRGLSVDGQKESALKTFLFKLQSWTKVQVWNSLRKSKWMTESSVLDELVFFGSFTSSKKNSNTFLSQRVTQSLWNMWRHGSRVAISSLTYSQQQMAQHCSCSAEAKRMGMSLCVKDSTLLSIINLRHQTKYLNVSIQSRTRRITHFSR